MWGEGRRGVFFDVAKGKRAKEEAGDVLVLVLVLWMRYADRE